MSPPPEHNSSASEPSPELKASTAPKGVAQAPRSPFSVARAERHERSRSPTKRSRTKEKKDKKDKKEKKPKREERKDQESPARPRSSGRRARSGGRREDQPRSPSRPPQRPRGKSQPPGNQGQKCKYCWKMLSGYDSSRRQHEFLNLSCLQWQIYGSMAPEQKKSDSAWYKAGQIAKTMRDKRLSGGETAPHTDEVSPRVDKSDVKPSLEGPSRAKKEKSHKDKSHKEKKAKAKRASPSPSGSSTPESSSKEEKHSKKKKKTAAGSKRSIVINIGWKCWLRCCYDPWPDLGVEIRLRLLLRLYRDCWETWEVAKRNSLVGWVDGSWNNMRCFLNLFQKVNQKFLN